MPKIREYVCACGNRFEHMHMCDTEAANCPACDGAVGDSDEVLGGQPLGVIVPMSKTSLKNKAGYVHTHGDRPAEKGSVSVPSNKGEF